MFCTPLTFTLVPEEDAYSTNTTPHWELCHCSELSGWTGNQLWIWLAICWPFGELHVPARGVEASRHLMDSGSQYEAPWRISVCSSVWSPWTSSSWRDFMTKSMSFLSLQKPTLWPQKNASCLKNRYLCVHEWHAQLFVAKMSILEKYVWRNVVYIDYFPSCQIMKEIQEHKIKIYEFPDTEDEEDNKLIRKIKVINKARRIYTHRPLY